MTLTTPADDRPRHDVVDHDPGAEEPERLLPQISILSLIGLITICAMIAWAIRTGFQGNFIWLKSLVVVILVAISCFVAYAAMFLLAYLFSLVTRPVFEASGRSLNRQRAAVPTPSASPAKPGEEEPQNA